MKTQSWPLRWPTSRHEALSRPWDPTPATSSSPICEWATGARRTSSRSRESRSSRSSAAGPTARLYPRAERRHRGLRGFLAKDILAAWPEMYALFDAFAEKGRLRKILAEGLGSCASPPIPTGCPMVFGSTASGTPSSCCTGTRRRRLPRPRLPLGLHPALARLVQAIEARDSGRRWARALQGRASALSRGLGHGHSVDPRPYATPLFESMTNRDSVRAEVERLLREGDPRGREHRRCPG